MTTGPWRLYRWRHTRGLLAGCLAHSVEEARMYMQRHYTRYGLAKEWELEPDLVERLEGWAAIVDDGGWI